MKRGKGQMEERPCHPAAGSTAGPQGHLHSGLGHSDRTVKAPVQPRAGKTGHRGCVRRGQREAASEVHGRDPCPCSLYHLDL